MEVLKIVVHFAILLIVALLGSSLDCDSCMHSFFIVIPSFSTFVSYISWQFL